MIPIRAISITFVFFFFHQTNPVGSGEGISGRHHPSNPSPAGMCPVGPVTDAPSCPRSCPSPDQASVNPRHLELGDRADNLRDERERRANGVDYAML